MTYDTWMLLLTWLQVIVQFVLLGVLVWGIVVVLRDK